MRHDEYVALDATALSGLVSRRETTATALLELALDRIRSVNPALNAVVRLMEDDARATAAAIDAGRSAAVGPFTGVPFLAKDLLADFAGHPTSRGSRLMKDLPAPHDTELVRRLKATGVVVVGKTNTPEWGLTPFTEPELWGPTRNPWDRERTPGGSSGGSAAAVAAGIVPMAGGGDGGGSIRIPSSCCGLFGLKPTRGRTPAGPDIGQAWRGAVVEHVLTRSVRDSAAMLDATQGPDAGAPYEIAPPGGPYVDEVGRDPGSLRIGWTTQPWIGSAVDPDCVAAVADAALLLEGLGHEVVETTLDIDGPAFARAFLTMVASELGADLAEVAEALGRRAKRADLEPATWALGLLAGAISAREYARAIRHLEGVGRVVGRHAAGYDLLLTPTLSCPPPPIGTLGPSPAEVTQLRIVGMFGSGRLVKIAGLLEEAAKDAFDFIPWTPVANVTGQPAMSVPLWWSGSGLPIGVHFTGRFGDEATLFRLAGQLERARPWFLRLPPATG